MIENNTITALNQLVESVGKSSVAYIKLIKNTKGYNWEIKQLSLNIEELEQLNNELINKFGSENGN